MAPRPSRFYRLVGGLSRPLVNGVFRLRHTGLEHLPEGGYVLAANHLSNFDPWALGMPLYPQRYLRFMGKSELFNPILGPIITAGGAFPVRRGQGDEEAIRTAEELCRQGHVVVMFPEGTRRRKGLRKRFESRPRSGAARIALNAGVPLVPAAIKGTDRLLRLGPLRVAYGPPVPVDDLLDPARDEHERAREATLRLMAEIERLGKTL